MRGMGLKRFCSEFLISSLREESATNELANLKLGGDEARRLCLTSSPADMEGVEPSSSLLMEKGRRFTCPVILFPDYRLAESCQEWADTLLLTRGQRFRSRTNPDRQRKTEELLLQFTLLCRTGIIAHATRLFRSTIVHLALLWGCVTPLHRLGSPPVGACRTVLKKEAHESFSPPPRRKLRQ